MTSRWSYPAKSRLYECEDEVNDLDLWQRFMYHQHVDDH